MLASLVGQSPMTRNSTRRSDLAIVLRSVKAVSSTAHALTDLARDGGGDARSGRRKAFGEVEPRK